MRLINGRVELGGIEGAMVALACGADPSPDLELEAFADWLVAPLSEHVSALRHGARYALAEYLRKALLEPPTGREDGLVWVITRHVGALVWLHSVGVRPDRIESDLDLSRVRPGDSVVGVVPLCLAAGIGARGASCWHIVMDLEAHDRGRALGPRRMRQRNARLVQFEARRLEPA